MKRFYTLLLGAAIPLLGLSQTASLPYQSLLYEDSDWTTEDLGSSKKWIDSDKSTYFAGVNASEKKGKLYSYDDYAAADDWLISPLFHLEAGTEYKVKYYYYSSSARWPERCAVWYGTAGTAAELKSSGIKIGVHDAGGVSEYVSYTFTPAASGDYHLALQACSDKGMYNLAVSDFQLRENVFAPGQPTDVTVTPGADRALEATVAWVWPTTDVDGAPISADATYDKAVITRDGVEVKTITDKTVTSWVDNADNGLTAGKHEYGVTCYVNGAPSAEVKVMSKYIGPVGAVGLPYKLSETDKDDFDLFWTFAKGEGSGSTNTPTFWVSASGSSRNIEYSAGGKAVDEWFIGPVLKFDEAGVYRVKVDYSFAQADKIFDMYLGTGASPAGFTEKVASFEGTTRTTEYKIISISEPCEKSLAFHMETDAEVYTITLWDFEVEKWHESPMHVTDLSAAVTGDDNEKVALSWINPATSNAGAAITALSKVEIYRGEELVTALTENIVPGQTSTYEDTPGTPGMFTYKIVPYLGDVACDDPAEVTAGWVGDETRTLPYNTVFGDITNPMWKTVDADPENGLAWTTPGDGVKPTLPAPESGFGKYNDYLVSPMIDFAEAGTYLISASIKGGSSTTTDNPGMQLEVGLVSDKSSDAGIISSFVSTGKRLQSYNVSYGKWLEIYINVETPGKYAVALFTPELNTAGQPNRLTASNNDLVLMSFGVSKTTLYPAAVSDPSVTGDPTGALKATLTWTNPSTFTTANVDATVVLTKVVIERKAQTASEWAEVHTITEGLVPGAQTSWVDETLPAAGVYSYSIIVYGPDGTAANDKGMTTVESGWLGAAAKLEIATANDDQAFHKDEWKIVSYKETGCWEFDYSGTKAYVTSQSTSTDEWLISPYYGFEAGKDYYFDVTSYTEDAGTILEVYYGTAQKASACDDTKICDLTMNGGISKDTWQHDKFILRAVAAGTPAATPEPVGDIPVYTVPAGTGVFAFRLQYSIGTIYQGGSVTLRNLFVTEFVPATGVTVTGAEGADEVTLGSTLALTATVAPENATIKDVVWASENTDIATVDANGIVTGVAVGEAKITATVGATVGELTVTVNPVLASAVTLDVTEKTVFVGEEFNLVATVAPENTTDPTVTWTSDNTEVATVAVSPEGTVTVTAVAPGTATITAACGETKATCAVTVNPVLATGVTLDLTEKTVLVGEEFTLVATVAPENTTDPTVTWTSDNAEVATVSAEGKVTAVGVGTATITAACGEAKATCAVTVNPVLASAVTLDVTEKEVVIGEEFTLVATVAPENTTDPTVTWTSDNAEVVTVSAEGKVTAVGVGTATITAACGEAKATCAVTVNPVEAESITLDKTVINAVEGTTVQLTATVLPANTTDPTITWTTSDPTVATVDQTGLVSILKAGECDITATCGNVSAVCKVTGVSGIAGIITDDLESIEVYTLGGVRLSDTLNLRPGFYIARYLKDGIVVTEKIRIK